MFSIKTCFIIGAIVTAVYGAAKESSLSKACLTCICEGVSKCDLAKKCTHNGGACGPFRITRPFWHDAGRPTVGETSPEDDKAFKECAFDFDCASISVKNYMEQFSQDCNNDKKINCIDYAHIFRLGGFGCNGQLDNLFGNRFNECQKGKKL